MSKVRTDGMQGCGPETCKNNKREGTNSRRARSHDDDIESDGIKDSKPDVKEGKVSPKLTPEQFLFNVASDRETLTRQDKNGNSFLHHFALRISDPALTQTLIDTLRKGNNFERDSSLQNTLGHTPLILSVINRNRTFTEMFLKSGVPLYHRDYLGKTVFHHFAQKNATLFLYEIFQSFQSDTLPIEEAARVLKMSDNEGLTAIQTALQEGNTVAFGEFHKLGGVDLLRQKDQKRKHTLLHMAAERGNLMMTENLLKDKELAIDVDELGADEATPLHLAVSNGHLDVVNYLLDAGADATIPLRECSVLGIIPQELEVEIRAVFAKKLDAKIYNFLSIVSDDYYGDPDEMSEDD